MLKDIQVTGKKDTRSGFGDGIVDDDFLICPIDVRIQGRVSRSAEAQ